ncbi:MAG: arginine--tRNA ligase [Candidatus Pacebacteria bacterium]|jgi:arginyl-tRNA synthetase|nr:arginine--tRNA ligase [Candidatus Paceibacterota bacterium]MBT6756038.1 arginine--tRNA ligase [Candidatus Paceibacterota bacterium]MBT6920890.1 arginine--tRNA ligase [Candidatus Paceibacterota bacterium]
MIADKIQKQLKKVLLELGIDNPKVQLEHPADETHGDWSTNIALQYHKQIDDFSNPRELAEAVIEKLKPFSEETHEIYKLSIAGPGFINFRLAKEYFRTRIIKMAEMNSPDFFAEYINKNKDKKVIVEYSSPNIAKPFTVGHLRSTIIGDAVANLYEVLGWQVYRDNHLGDWGTQFGKLIYAIKTWGDREEISESKNPIKDLVKLYIKFHEEAEEKPEIEDIGRSWFRKLEEGDDEARSLWNWCIELSWKEFRGIYGELGISFTENNGRGYGESFFEDKMSEVVSLLEEKLTPEDAVKNGAHYAEGDNGAKLIFFEDEKYPPMMLMKKDGATLYSTRDFATDYFRLAQYDNPDLIVNEVGAEQSLYFEQLYKVEQIMGWYKPGQRVHVKHGLYRFKDKKMSTRRGNVIWLEDVIAEAKKRAEALSPDKKHIAHVVAIGALKWNDLKSETTRDIIFDWDDLLSMKGNSGPYIQYATVRAKSVLRKAALEEFYPGFGDDSWKLDKDEMSLVRHLDRFTEVVEQAAKEFAPHHLATYLFELAQRFNGFYNTHPIINAENSDARERRCTLTQVAAKVLEYGLSLLGIQTPEEM